MGCNQQATKKEEARDPKIDSIQELLKIAKTAKELPLNERQAYIEDAELRALTLPEDSIRLEQLSRVSLAFKRIKDSSGFRLSNAKLLKLSKKAKADKILGYSNWDLGDFFNHME